MLLASTSYRAKVITLDAFLATHRAGGRRIILAHGVFDLVHPGHIRHLTYAKEKGGPLGLLVVNITADVHITKGVHRPFVPEELRALNLAALEMVDYVLIDRNPTPLETIRRIKPDYFAKGFEYNGGANPNTAAELAAVSACGGEMLFTPGDVVYSSSNIIESDPPNLALEKLMLLMDAEGISFERLRAVLTRFKDKYVHVVGDTIVDSLSHCTMLSGMGMAKTPTPSVIVDRRVDFVGGAAVVAKHLKAAGASVTLSTLVCGDQLGKFVMDDLANAGISVDPVVDASRPTTHKNAFVVAGYRLLKVDTVDNRSINEPQLHHLADNLSLQAEAVVFSDFRHGIFNRNTIPTLIEASCGCKFRVADSQVASRWGNILEFPGMDLITPNEKEARFALGDQDGGVRTLAARLLEAAQCKTVMLKLGDKGLITCRGKDLDDPRTYFGVDSFAKAVADPVGAGDAFLAYATLASLVDPSAVVASVLGAIAAAIECEREGNEPVNSSDVCERVDIIEELCRS